MAKPTARCGPGPDLPGFSGADEGVPACTADSLANQILGFDTPKIRGQPSRFRGNAIQGRHDFLPALWSLVVTFFQDAGNWSCAAEPGTQVKSSRTSPGAAIHYFASRLGVRHKFLVVGEPIEAGAAGDVRVLDASAFLAALPV